MTAGADSNAVSASTCWTLIHGAAMGNHAAREAFARSYAPVARAYLGARWRHTPLAAEVDDAVQDVFLACFQAGGALDRVDPARGGFRPFFFGVVRNIALRHETDRARHRADPLPSDLDIAGHEAALSQVFDQAWAREIMRQAAERQSLRAHEQGPAAVRRIELLRLRFQDGLPIRAIADRWKVDRDWLHHEYAQARQEFRVALVEVVRFHHVGAAAEIEHEVARLLHHLAAR